MRDSPCIELSILQSSSATVSEPTRKLCELDGKSFNDGFSEVTLLTAEFRSARLFLTFKVIPLNLVPTLEVECITGVSSQGITAPECQEVAKIPDSCLRVINSLQLSVCFRARKDDADSRLNQTYQALLQRIGNAYRSSPEKKDLLKSQLKNAQRQWIYLRDADCELMAFEAEPGSQAHEGNVNQCVTAATQFRSRQLREMSSQLTPQEMIEQ